MTSDRVGRSVLERLLTRVARGDRGALAALYDCTAPSLFAALAAELADECAAEDALRRVYLALWVEGPRYRGAAAAWISGRLRREADRARAAARPRTSADSPA